jgi:hypothetical protein
LLVPFYQVDAFANRRYGGNPAAVMLLERFVDDVLLQAIALENNLAETAFLVPNSEDYRLRWFTPKVEVSLCGPRDTRQRCGRYGASGTAPQTRIVPFSQRSIECGAHCNWIRYELSGQCFGACRGAAPPG